MLGWVFSLIVLGVIVEAVVTLTRPLLPFIGIGVLTVAGIILALRLRNPGW